MAGCAIPVVVLARRSRLRHPATEWTHLAVLIDEPGRLIACNCQQAFDIAADVERYPEFLRGWISVRVQSREANICRVDQVLGLGPIRVKFVSTAVLQRPQRIEVTSSEAPFRYFRLTWRFETAPQDAGCRVSLSASVDLRSEMLQHVVDRLLPALIADTIAAFENRVRRQTSGPVA